MTRKHYVAIAEILNDYNKDPQDGSMSPYSIEERLADYFTQDNPRFDRERFLTACGIEHDCQGCGATRMTTGELCDSCRGIPEYRR